VQSIEEILALISTRLMEPSIDIYKDISLTKIQIDLIVIDAEIIELATPLLK
jgi:hypothetical protein